MKDRETTPKKLTRLKRILDEIIVPCAMVLVAMAFGAGLYFQAGFGLMSALIAAVTIFLVMICAQSAFVGTQRAAHAVERVDALEAAYKGGLNGDSEQLAQLAAKVAQIDGLPERVKQIEALAERIDALDQEVTLVRRDRTEVDPARIQRLAAEVDRLDARQEALRTQLQIESRERHEDLSAELKMLETLVKQMAENIAVSKRAAQEVTSAAKSPAVQADKVPSQERPEAPLGEPDEPAQRQSLAEDHSRERGKLEEIVREKLSESIAENRPEPLKPDTARGRRR